MRRPAAYLRKSNDSTTKQEHLDRLMRSVADHAEGDPIVYDDWARSGDIAKLGQRTEWRRLCDDIEAGRISAVFMNDLDRGGRSLEEWLRFIRIAQRHDVRVIAGGSDYSAPENKDKLIFEGWLAERELDAAKRRARETIRMRRRRGDAIGGAPYGKKFGKADDGKVVLVDDPDRPVAPVLAAYEDAGGNIAKAVLLLNDRGVPSRFGKAWTDAALRGLLRREGHALPARKRLRSNGRGKLLAPSPLSRLVACHCGHLMTPVDSRVELYCYKGSRLGATRHGKTKTTQRPIWEFLKAQLGPKGGGYHIDYDIGTRDATGRRDALKEELRRLGVAYRAGAVEDSEFEDESARLRDEIEQIRDEGEIVGGSGAVIPDIDWDADSVTLGEALRRRVRRLELDGDLRPTRIEWRGRPA